MPQLFATFFSDKFQPTNIPLFYPSSVSSIFTPFSTPLFHSEIDNLLSQFFDSYCDLDPVPTTVLRQISNDISPTILSIVNLSITTGTFPSTLKSSIISPLSKKLHSMKIFVIAAILRNSPLFPN